MEAALSLRISRRSVTASRARALSSEARRSALAMPLRCCAGSTASEYMRASEVPVLNISIAQPRITPPSSSSTVSAVPLVSRLRKLRRDRRSLSKQRFSTSTKASRSSRVASRIMRLCYHARRADREAGQPRFTAWARGPRRLSSDANPGTLAVARGRIAMPDSRFDRYYRHEALTTLLHALAERHPALMRLASIGKSFEGRDVWLATVTAFAHGDDRDKPAFWVDGNIHAPELAGSSACLYFIHQLLNGYGLDADITRCLDSRVFYICPRVFPDGAEYALADTPRLIRSGTRPYPYEEAPVQSLVREAIDGDGRRLSMRIRDPDGPWKGASDDARLMVPREPAETGGEYYRLLPEGRIAHYDGALIGVPPPVEGLDLNRNFPAQWREEAQQTGAGLYPASEPEVQNLVRFVADHPNICGGVAFHCYSGVLLRPLSYQSDDDMPAEDLWGFHKIGAQGTSITGYPAASAYHEFRYHPKEIITGAFDDWLYEQQGVFAWTVEIWSPQREAGIGEYRYIDWYRDHPITDDLKLLKWNDEVLDGAGFVPWYPYEHPLF